MLAVAGGAWALFGRDATKKTEVTAGPKPVATSAPARPAGPSVPGTTPRARTSPSPTAPAAAPATASQPAATTSPTPAPTKAPAVKATPVATTPPATVQPPTAKPTTAKPPVSSPQVGGTVAAKAYSFRVARGDTLWGLTKQVLRDTGRSTSNANVDAYVTKLYAANRAVIGSDPDLILVGWTLRWPAGL